MEGRMRGRRCGECGVKKGQRREKGGRRKLGEFGTYFLLLLLFSEEDSLRWPSSEGGVAEMFSFLGLAAGMIVWRTYFRHKRDVG